MRSSDTSHRTFGLPLLCAVTLATSLIGAASGLWIGAASSPRVAFETVECPSAPPDLESPSGEASPNMNSELAEALERSLISGLQLASRLDSLERLAEESDRQGLRPPEAASAIVSGLRDSDLPILAGMLAGLSQDELTSLDDLRGFTRRLTEIAIAGELEGEVAEDHPGTPPLELLFAGEEEIQNPSLIAAHRFPAESRNIFAIARTRDLEQRTVMVRWSRVDRPKILALEYRPITRNSDWTALPHAPGTDWPVGRYRVTVYRFGAKLEQLASATFSIERPAE